MFASIRFTSVVHLGLAAVAVLGEQLDKPSAWKNLDEFGPTLNALPAVSYGIAPWVNGGISQDCRDRVLLAKGDPTKFKTYTVYLSDCDTPWVICQEEGAEVSIEKLVDTFARVPIGLRQFVGDVVHLKGGSGASAWGDIVHVSGVSANHVGVFIHEASHCVDGANGIGMKSIDKTWLDAYNKDTHVADDYARSSHTENFAQYAGLVLYDRFTKGDLQKYKQYSQIKNQISRMARAVDQRQDWGEKMLDWSGTKKCGRHTPPSPAVDPKSGKVIEKRDFVAPRNTGIIIEARKDDKSSRTLSSCNIGSSF